MKVEQIYTNCLAHGAYYIENNGEAAIIDPLREVQPYIDLAESREAKIKYVFETHFHADFVSGHIDLAKRTGAEIVYGPTEMEMGFEATVAEDNQEFALGDLKIRVLHTPGHTLESSCYLLLDENGKMTSIFTGDTLFIGDVGRPDLAQKVIADLTQEKLASMMYDSLHNKIMPLDDDIIVYPGHGAGSACGKNMSNETSDTLGNQKRTNYALDPGLSREQFIEALLTGLTPPPSYFPQNVMMNIGGYEDVEQVVQRGSRPLSVEDFKRIRAEENAHVLDVRESQEFCEGFVPGSYNIGIDGGFAVWVGTVMRDVKEPILLVTPPGREVEAATRLARVGFDNTLGYLDGGIEAWKAAGEEVDQIESIPPEKLAEVDANAIIDGRKKSEYDSEHVIGATNTPLDYWWEHLEGLDKDKRQYVYCAGGYRSMAFVSILRAHGYKNLVDVQGGFKKIKELGQVELSDYVCPTTML